MGIDAELLVRVRAATKPTEAQIARWSWDLAQAIGPEKFFIKDGLPPDEYRRASSAWHAAFDAHPLYRQWSAARHDHEARTKIHDSIFADVGKPPEERRRALDLTRAYEEDGDAEPGKLWTQDGPDIVAEDGEWFLRVSLWSRYYGVGYERGDLLTICAVAEWIEFNIPDCAVWYGGDSSGVLAEPFDAPARHKLKKHLFSLQGRDYFQHERRGSFPTPPPCSLCIPGEPRFDRHGWGATMAVNCGGCGKTFESRDSGKTWAIAEEK